MGSIEKKRVYSFIVDIAISNLLCMIIFSALNLKYNFYESSFIFLNSKINYGFSFQIIIVFLYFIIFDLFNGGKSFGKLLFSINVVSKKNLEILSLKSLLIRTFYKIIGIIFFPISFILFFIYGGFSIQDRYSNSKTIETTSK